MKFTRLRVSGFKSFCDPFELEIRPGLTGIVGPNGCGKSNLVDALRWVLGESSAKGLRGTEMDDVIFGGSVARAPRDVAEVGLLVEGPLEGFLVLAPGERAEIVRRIERGTGSSWRIGGREVRQRDVALLLADAAAGARSVAIVSQGQIGLLVDARADERRRLLEEAAGISGLRLRRREAEQRLAETEANLARVRELAARASEQLEKLRAQAAEAERYRRISAELRATETALLLRRCAQAVDAYAAAKAQYEQARAAEEEVQAALARARSERAERAAELARLRERLERATTEAARLAERLRAAEAQHAREQEERARRRAEIERDLEAVRRERAALTTELAAKNAELEALVRAREELAAQLAKTAADLAAAEQREAEALAAREAALAARLALAGFARLEDEVREWEARASEAARRLASEDAASDGCAAAREALARAQADLETARAREAELREKIATLEATVARARDEAAEIANQELATRAQLAALEAEARAFERSRRARSERLAALARSRARLDEQRKALRARLAALEREEAGIDLAALARARADAEHTLDTALEAERRALEEQRCAELELVESANALAAARANYARIEAEECRLQRSTAAHADAAAAPILAKIERTRGFERALAAVLGEALFAGTDPSAQRFWRLIEGSEALPALPDGVTALTACVQAPPELARHLALVGLCTPEQAERLQPLLRPGQSLVSRDGGLWRWDGFVCRPGADEIGLRLARLEALAAERAEAERTLAQLTGRMAEAERRRDAAVAAAEAAARALAQSRAEKERCERRYAEARAIVERARSERVRLEELVQRLEIEAAELEREQAELSEPAEDGPACELLESLKERAQSLASALKTAKSRSATLESELAALRRELATLTQLIRALAEEVERQRAALAHAESARLRRESERERLVRERAEAEQRVCALRAELARVAPEQERATKHLAATETALAEAQRARSELERALASLRVQRSGTEARIAALEAELPPLAEREAGQRQRERALEERLRELVQSAEHESETQAALEALRRDEADAQAARTMATAEVERAERAIAELDQRIAELEARRASSIEYSARCRAEEARARNTVEATRAAVRERLGRPPEAFASWSEPAELARLSSEELERLTLGLRARRDRMGPVNLRAEEEVAQLERELARMRAEEAEVRAATERLSRAIATIDREARSRLLQTFTSVEDHFRRLFARLFGGGRAELRLCDLDDPLSAGLEIEAQPPGKRLAHVALLSGGEKALTGLALVFAFFLARPSPLCVLDEVDAPLDDANVARFTTLMGEIAREIGTRFLVVTHHPLTMARMDRLYGVTMVERGVSRLLSVELAQALELRLTA